MSNTTQNYSIIDSLIKWKFYPDWNTFGIPNFNKPLPEWPFEYQNYFLKSIFYPISLNGFVTVLISVIYFLSVKYFNKIILNRQIKLFKLENKNTKLPLNLKKLKPAPFEISKSFAFKKFVLIHNFLLTIYSIWTFIGMTNTIIKLSNINLPNFLTNFQKSNLSPLSKSELFWQTICNNSFTNNNIWLNFNQFNIKGLTFYAYLFYLSKFYEILDTVIILLKGKPSSLLQSYHHSGAILCMWSGVRYQSSPIWIFVVFNSFMHSLMYFYFTLCCLNIKLPKIFKQTLTTLQILQFIIGGSLAVIHLFVRYHNLINDDFNSCISTAEQALAVYINVFYLAPLTLLFGAFYLDSYKKKKALVDKKVI